jgi:hypothetical protein
VNRDDRVSSVLRAGGPATPPALRARLRALQAPRTERPRPTLRLAVAAATALAAFGAVLAIALTTGSPTVPSVGDVAAAANRPATAPAPARDPQDPPLLRASFAGVAYPYWKQHFGWRTTGVRTDTIDGRRARTVFYQHTHHRIGYTVVSGEPLKRPAGAERLVVDGVEMYRYRAGRNTVVSFVRHGHTCVLAGYVHFQTTLPKLASWNGRGAIAF